MFASALGRWVDYTPSRLRVLLTTIIVNRISILVSCLTWFVILSLSYAAPKRVCFAVALIIGMVEKLSRGTNIISMERDWVPTLANTSVDARHRVSYDLTHLNTIIRRIDMLCKLIAPLAVSVFISKVGSERLAIVVLAAISTLSLGPECWGVQKVWGQNIRLRARKGRVDEVVTRGDQDSPIQLYYTKIRSARLASNLHGKIILQAMDSIRAYVADLGYYFSTSVWIPSLCAAIPHASVLTFSGTMLTYLLNAGYPLSTITGAKASGAVFEIASTFLFPWAVRILSISKRSPGSYHREGYHEVEQREPASRADTSFSDTDNDQVQSSRSSPIIEQSIMRIGSWALGALLLTLVSPTAAPTLSSSFLNDQCRLSNLQIPAVLGLFFLDTRLNETAPSTSDPHQSPTTSYPLITIILIVSISLSLLFRWTYDLCATQLTQALVPANKRSSFGGTEMSIVSLVSLGHWIAAAVWHTQSDFKWLALGSLVVVAMGVGAYRWWQGWWGSQERASGDRIGEGLETDIR